LTAYLTSNRRVDDHGPPSFARTRHHSRRVGSVLVAYADGATVAPTITGDENDYESSVWIV
jgi:hypothetical protein